MTGLASSSLHIASTLVRAAALSPSGSSISISFPWRTSPMPVKPSDARALPIALPCGSSTPDLRLTCTSAFIAPISLHRPWTLEISGTAFGQDAEPAGHFLIAFGDLFEVLAKPVLVELFAGTDVPQPHVVRADLVGEDDAHVVIAVEPAELEPEIDEPDSHAEKKAAEEIVDPQRNLHDLVEVLGARPGKRCYVFLADQRVAKLGLLVMVFDHRAGQGSTFGQAQPLCQRPCRDIAHDHTQRDDLDLAHELLAHVQPTHEMRRDADLGELQHQEFADPVVEHALAGDRATLLVVEGRGVVLEILHQRAGLGALEEHLGRPFIDLPASRHAGSRSAPQDRGEHP